VVTAIAVDLVIDGVDMHIKEGAAQCPHGIFGSVGGSGLFR
jgi:hypothetical protein